MGRAKKPGVVPPNSRKGVTGRDIVGANVRRLRKERGLTQQELGERSGLHWTYIGDVERAERNVSVDALCELAVGLNVSLNELVAVVPSAPGDPAPRKRR